MPALSNFIPDWLAKRAALSPDKIALRVAESGEAVSFAAWNRNANRMAHFFLQLGLRQGDRVAILAPNCTAYLDAWFACNKTGVILQTLNWRLAAPELAQIIAAASPQALVYAPEFGDTVKALQNALPQIGHWISIGETLRESDLPLTRSTSCPDTPPPPVMLQENDAWVICYTGGTTGLPKGALLTYGAIHANAVNTVMSWGLTADDTAILNAPLFHTGGLNVFTAPLVQVGGASILCRSFDPGQVFELIENGGVTLFFGVPTMFTLLRQHPAWETADFSRLKLVISGGAPCPERIYRDFWERGVDFKSGYGLTEAGPNTFWLPPADVRRKPGSVGVPLFHIQARVIGAGGRECGPEQTGELQIRGPHVFGGYWNNPQATAEAVQDGWLHTGDLARYDAEGYFYIAGRLKEMFISGGENIYPAEIENVLYDCPDVAEAAVIGIPDALWGETGCAVIVRKREALSEAELLAFCRTRLAKYKIPKRIVFTRALPKTGAGKIDKPALLRLAENLFTVEKQSSGK